MPAQPRTGHHQVEEEPAEERQQLTPIGTRIDLADKAQPTQQLGALHEVAGTRYMEELRETDPKLLEAEVPQGVMYRSLSVQHPRQWRLSYEAA